MEDGRARDPDEGADLEAVWGRDASATAPPAPRPDLGALFAPPATEGVVVGPRRGRRGPVLAGLAVAVVAAVVAAVVLLGGEDDPEPDPVPEAEARPTTTTVPEPTVLGPPAWTAATVCPRYEEITGQGRAVCLVAADDERVYVLVDAAGTQSLRALDLATGQVRWEEPFPEGAGSLERLPSVVAVGGVGSRAPTDGTPPDLGATVALDPVTGERLWSRPGTLVGPVGRDRVILDATPIASDREAMAVVEATTGREVLGRETTGVPLYVHPCGEDRVLVSEGDRLTAHDAADGSIHWSVPAPHRDTYWTVRCDRDRIAYVDLGTLVLLDAETAASIGGVSVTGAGAEDDSSQVLALVGDTVVVGSLDGARGFRADEGMAELWHVPCTECGPGLLVGGTGGGDVIVVSGGEAVVRDGGDGTPGPRLVLDGGTEKVLADGSLLAWDAGAVTWADPLDLGRSARIEVEGVRLAVATATHVVVATRDEVRAYARDA